MGKHIPYKCFLIIVGAHKIKKIGIGIFDASAVGAEKLLRHFVHLLMQFGP